MGFEDVFGAKADAIAEAHGRVNLLGEHTDYNDGYVLPTAIPQKTRVAVRRSGSAGYTVHSANLSETVRFSLDTLPEQQFARYVHGCIDQLTRRAGSLPPLELFVESTVPIGVGLSSSAALEVALLRAVDSLQQLSLDPVTIARLAQRAEIESAGVNCGILDQMAASLLVPGSMLFLDTRSMESSQLPLPGGAEILVVDSGISRSLAASKYNERRAECEEAAKRLGCATLRDASDRAAIERLPEPWRRRARHVTTENERTRMAAEGADAQMFGSLMNQSHASLRDDYEVSIPQLDALVRLLGKHPGVYGAKLTGAGFGGACVALCRAGEALRIGQDVVARYNAAGSRSSILVPFIGEA